MSDMENWKPEIDIVSDEDVEMIEQGEDPTAISFRREVVDLLEDGRALVINEIEFTIPGIVSGGTIKPRARRGLEHASPSVVTDLDRVQFADEQQGITDAESIEVKPRRIPLGHMPTTVAAPGSRLAELQDEMKAALDRRAGIIETHGKE